MGTVTRGLIFCLILGCAGAQASELSEEALYVRCYAQFTGLRVPFNDPDLLAVKAGGKTALNACQSLLERAVLNANGMLKNPSDKVAVQVLNHFYKMSRPWFTVQRLQDGIPNSACRFATGDLYDETMGALFQAGVAFDPQKTYAWIVAQGSQMFGVRRQLTPNKFTTTYAVSRNYKDTVYGLQPDFVVKYLFGSTVPYSYFSAPLITIGDLVGITSNGVDSAGNPEGGPFPAAVLLSGSNVNPDVLDFDPNLPLTGPHPSSQEPGLHSVVNLRENKENAGGLIGTPEYMMMNLGYNYETISDGSLKVFRRYGKNIMADLLCRELPVLRESDVPQFVAPDSDAPFRKSTTCLRCHATIDQMAYTVRNMRWITAGRGCPADPKTQGLDTAHLTSYLPSQSGSSNWQAQGTADFHLQQPYGRLYFRSYNGKLVNEEVLGVSGLGLALAKTDDLYVCAAKRYFKEFTGINVSLYDMGDASNSGLNRQLNAKDFEYRKFVETIGLKFKQHQNVRTLIKDIISSKYYRKSDFGKSEEAAK